jgi:hypothetical protein
MKKTYENQIREFVYEPYDKELDGNLTPFKKIEELEEGFTLCEDEGGFKFVIKNYKKKNQKVFVVCDILND